MGPRRQGKNRDLVFLSTLPVSMIHLQSHYSKSVAPLTLQLEENVSASHILSFGLPAEEYQITHEISVA